MANPELTPEEEAQIINGYWSGPSYAAPAAPVPAPAVPPPVAAPPPPTLPFQPNPGADNYNPNPGATSGGPPPPRNAVLGALPGAAPPNPNAPNPHPLFQNPFQQPIDMGEVDPPAPNLPAPAPAPMGPSPADDAAFAAFRAKQDAPAEKKVASYWGGTPSAKANPDPYGIGAAQQGQVDALGRRSDALKRAADADAVKAVQVAEGQRDLGRMQQEDAAIANAENELSQRHFSEGMQEIGRQLDDVRAKKIDPLRQMKESPALGVLAVIGGALGGFYQGITGGQTNEFLADLDRQIDRGIAEDQRQIDTQKWSLGHASNLLAQQHDVQKDADLAKLQYRNLTYEAAKQQIAAEAADNDSPAARARADEAIAMVDFQQKQLQEEIGLRKQKQAAALAGAGMAQAKEVRDFRFKVYEGLLKEGYSPAQAEEESRRQVAIQYLGGVGARPRGSGMDRRGPTREQQGKLEIEHGETNRSTAEFNKQIDALKKHPAITKSGIDTSTLAHLPQRMAPESNKYDQDLKEINTRILQAIGKVAKDADGKPNKAMLDKLEERFEIQQGDSTPIKLQKLEGARDIYNSLARQQGASDAPEPDRRESIEAELGAKPVR